MAKLIFQRSPYIAIGFKKGVTTRKVPAKAKFHLMKDDTLTVCGFLVFGDRSLTTFVDDNTRDKLYEIRSIESLPAERLCTKCLGPLKATDED